MKETKDGIIIGYIPPEEPKPSTKKTTEKKSK